MAHDLLIELVTQDDHVLAITWQRLLFGISGIPDPSFGHEAEACPVNNDGPRALRVRTEEDRRPKTR
jgi:hypothetical protein